MEEIDDKFPLFEMLKIHEFAWFPKIKTLTASYFLKNTNFFFFFEKNMFFSWNLDDFVKNAKLWGFVFFDKKNKTLFRNRICHKILKISLKIRQIRDLQRRTTSKNQCKCFFSFFSFFEKIFIHKGFFEYFFQKKQKIHEKVC